MRLLVCDYHVVFAEALAHVLAARGATIVGVTHDPDQLLRVLRREPVDVCLLDVVFGTHSAVQRLAELGAAAPTARFVLLAAEAGPGLVEAGRAAGVRGIGDKRQPVSAIVELLARVHAGELVLRPGPAAGPRAPRAAARPQNDAQRLAGYLTPREREVLSALVRGDDTNKLARSLGIAAATARCHVQNVLTKLGAHSRLEAATSAVRYGMISPETGDWLTPVV
jgi:two-component system nitrate/nitrite response regulator NarL